MLIRRAYKVKPLLMSVFVGTLISSTYATDKLQEDRAIIQETNHKYCVSLFENAVKKPLESLNIPENDYLVTRNELIKKFCDQCQAENIITQCKEVLWKNNLPFIDNLVDAPLEITSCKFRYSFDSKLAL